MTIPILKPGESLPPDVPFAYVTARGGHFLKKRGPFFEACVRVAEIPTLEEERESYTFLGPKIPAALFSRILAFFHGVHREHGTEGAVLLTFEGGRWDVLVPEQETTGASVKYKIPAGQHVAGSVHSHPGFTSKFSVTDEKDEAEFDGVHACIGSGGFLKADVSVAAVVSGRRIELDPEDIIEGYDTDAEFPLEWLSRVTAENFQKSLFDRRSLMPYEHDPPWHDDPFWFRDLNDARKEGP
jgi:hypothetical protein